ncbi:hypothetical protein J3A68_001434 [Paenibacillus sp. PvP052]|nr:hypothetical protein [Paenibacillus sp. PvP052]
MLGLFKDSTIRYDGIVSMAEPIRMEATFTITPKGAASPIELPILLKDNKMYLHLPAVNQTDEYMMLPLEIMPGTLNQTAGLASGINVKLLEGIDPEWLEPGSKDVALSTGEPAKRISLAVNENNRSEVSTHFSAFLPGLLNDLMTGGLISADQTESIKALTQRWRMTAPASISTLIDEQGFNREQSGRLSFTDKDTRQSCECNRVDSKNRRCKSKVEFY